MDFPPKSSSPEDWFNRCRELCEPLSKEGCKFSFSLQVGTFSFSLKSEGVRLRTKKRRPTPSYLRRQERRKADLLKRRSEQHAEKSAVKGLAQGGENLLNKKMTSPMQVQEGATLLSKKTAPSMQSQAASASNKILETPPESVKRRSITRLKRDENLTASFHQLDGVPILSPNDSVTEEENEEREKEGEGDLRGERSQQVRQPDLLKTPLDYDSDGGKPDELTGPTTKTDLSGDVKEAAGREATSPDPLGPPLPKYCGTCEDEEPLVQSDWGARQLEWANQLRLITQGYLCPPIRRDCVRCWQENEDKKWQEELDNLSSSSDNGF